MSSSPRSSTTYDESLKGVGTYVSVMSDYLHGFEKSDKPVDQTFSRKSIMQHTAVVSNTM